MGIIADFANLKEAIEAYTKDPTNDNADRIAVIKGVLESKYGRACVQRQTHQIFQGIPKIPA